MESIGKFKYMYIITNFPESCNDGVRLQLFSWLALYGEQRCWCVHWLLLSPSAPISRNEVSKLTEETHLQVYMTVMSWWRYYILWLLLIHFPRWQMTTTRSHSFILSDALKKLPLHGVFKYLFTPTEISASFLSPWSKPLFILNSRWNLVRLENYSCANTFRCFGLVLQFPN